MGFGVQIEFKNSKLFRFFFRLFFSFGRLPELFYRSPLLSILGLLKGGSLCEIEK